jgi:hypothetical protein
MTLKIGYFFEVE